MHIRLLRPVPLHGQPFSPESITPGQEQTMFTGVTGQNGANLRAWKMSSHWNNSLSNMAIRHWEVERSIIARRPPGRPQARQNRPTGTSIIPVPTFPIHFRFVHRRKSSIRQMLITRAGPVAADGGPGAPFLSPMKKWQIITW